VIDELVVEIIKPSKKCDVIAEIGDHLVRELLLRVTWIVKQIDMAFLRFFMIFIVWQQIDNKFPHSVQYED